MASMNTTGYTRSNGRCCHSAIDSSTRSVMRLIVSRHTSAPLSHMAPPLAGGQPLGHQRPHQPVPPSQPPLTFTHDLGFEGAVAVPRHVHLDRADVGHHRLGADPVARVAAVVPGAVVGL